MYRSFLPWREEAFAARTRVKTAYHMCVYTIIDVRQQPRVVSSRQRRFYTVLCCCSRLSGLMIFVSPTGWKGFPLFDKVCVIQGPSHRAQRITGAIKNSSSVVVELCVEMETHTYSLRLFCKRGA